MNPLNHVAIIMDGNGRWGLKYKNSRNAGHKAGINSVEKVIKESIKQNIKPIAVYDEMSSSYLSYAMSVIISRALPDICLLYTSDAADE